jgi:hypothetical protein
MARTIAPSLLKLSAVEERRQWVRGNRERERERERKSACKTEREEGSPKRHT